MTSPEEGKAHMGKWMNWLTGLGRPWFITPHR
jgi:hypothetical protein